MLGKLIAFHQTLQFCCGVIHSYSVDITDVFAHHQLESRANGKIKEWRDFFHGRAASNQRSELWTLGSQGHEVPNIHKVTTWFIY